MRVAVLGRKLSGVGSGAHLTHLEIARYLAERGHQVEYAALVGESRTRFGDPVAVGGAQLARAVGRADVVLVRDEPKVSSLLGHCRGARVLYTCHSPAGDPRALGVTLPADSTVVYVSACLRDQVEAQRGPYPGEALVIEGLPIDLYLVHAPDPRTPWRTSVRALARLVDDGLVRSVGVSNVNRRQLDEALALAPIMAVEVAVSLFDDRALRGGVIERCLEAGVAVVAHSPLGGPRPRSIGGRPGSQAGRRGRRR